MNSEELLVVMTLFGGMTLVGLAAIIGGFLHSRRERLLTHQERMKALELGRELPDDTPVGRLKRALGARSNTEENDGRSLARKCFSTALWVPFWGFIFASQGVWVNTGLAAAIVIACSAGAIAVTAIICGTILAVHERSGSSPLADAKPLIESDAFDVVSRRG
jgi:hypothetical protein